MSVELAKVRARFELTSSSAVTIDSSVILSSISDDGNGRNFSNSSSSDSSNSSSSSSGYQLNGNWRKIINVLREVGNVFIISKGTDDELNKSNITSLLDSIGFPKHRLLVCDTEKGKIAIVRQLVPRFVSSCFYLDLELTPFYISSQYFFLFVNRIHIDSDRNFISTVSPHIPYAIEVKGPPAFFSCEALI